MPPVKPPEIMVAIVSSRSTGPTWGCNLSAYSFFLLEIIFSLLVLPGWAMDTAGAVGGGAAPDALVAAWAMAVLARWGVDTSRTVA